MKRCNGLLLLLLTSLACIKDQELNNVSLVSVECEGNRKEMEGYLKTKWGSDYQRKEFNEITSITDDRGTTDDKILGYVCCFPNLTSLTASWSKNVTDIGVKKFVECSLKNGNQRMNGINFQGTSITNETVKSLSELKEVDELFLDDNDKINDTAIQYFKKFTSIGSLSIVATGITAEGAEKLRKMKHIQGVDSEYHVPANQE
ncbi:hypothetical protein B1J93_04725 [Leptospira kirschneri serovar Pomona]|uniref:Lipoprotein n=1 Tax=Leptospira kirschneri serovar Pomona TaxID=561005 RepID=A0A1T1DXG0_9LEPT|nr:hypothetical protein [Leptospira kirschneri]OOV45512.1 hypothetical protein B1J93_04725 [Leptospira kirschneri serovar Pomona]